MADFILNRVWKIKENLRPSVYGVPVSVLARRLKLHSVAAEEIPIQRMLGGVLVFKDSRRRTSLPATAVSQENQI